MTYAGFTPPSVVVGASFGRSTNLILPNDWRPDRSYPLLVLLHSYGATASDIRTRLGHAAAHNFDDGCIVFAPTGTLDGANTHWNYWTTGGGTDFDFLASCITEARSRFNISWCGVLGYSNGGFMALQLSIQRPDLVHALATFACAAGVNDPTSVTGTPVPHIHFHATIDGTVSPAGDVTGLLPGALNGHGGVGSVGYTDTSGTVTKSAQRNGLGAGSLGAPGAAYDIWSLNNPSANESANEVWSGGSSQTQVYRVLATTAVDGHGLTVSTPTRGGNPIHSWMRANHRTP